jgi:hypothetical protein
LLAMIADWRGFSNSAIREEELRDLREHGRAGVPLGNATFVERLEQTVGRALRAGKPGRPRKLLKRPVRVPGMKCVPGMNMMILLGWNYHRADKCRSL